MEYKTDKRTKNLTLRDIHVGDWVQVWSETTERYSPPLKIIQICDDGTIYLVTSDEERPTPWEEEIKNEDALPIDKEILEGFGFALDYSFATSNHCKFYEVYYNKRHIGHYETDAQRPNRNRLVILNNQCMYIETLCQVLNKNFPNIKLEWKGLRNDRAGI